MRHALRNQVATCLSTCLAAGIAAGCTARGSTGDVSGAPPPAVVDRDEAGNTMRVEHPERFPLATAIGRNASTELGVTGVVNPDVSRAVPVVSLASGRVIELRVRLGDPVRKGQLLLRIQSHDVSSAFSDYRKAAADQVLTQEQLARAQALFERGAIAGKDLEVAQDAGAKARVDVETAAEHLRVLGMLSLIHI